MDQSWTDAIATLRHRYYPFPGWQVSDGEITLAMLTAAQYDIALAWVVRWEWNPNHQLPVSLALAKPLKSLAEVLRAISNLCDKSHAVQEMVVKKNTYPHASAWFREVYWELVCAATIRAITPIEISDRRKKQRLAEGWLNERSLLKDFQSPIKETDQMPATLALFDAAIALAQQSVPFNRKYYQPLLKAMAADIQARSGVGWSCAYIDEAGQPYLQTGQGRGRRNIAIPEHVKKLNDRSVAG